MQIYSDLIVSRIELGDRSAKDLRTLLEVTQDKLNKLKKDSTANEKLILQERIILEATRREIQRLERKTLYSEFGIE